MHALQLIVQYLKAQRIAPTQRYACCGFGWLKCTQSMKTMGHDGLKGKDVIVTGPNIRQNEAASSGLGVEKR